MGGCPVFPTPFFEDAILSPTHFLGSFVKNQMAVTVWFCI
jgi:hypothetical protein